MTPSSTGPKSLAGIIEYKLVFFFKEKKLVPNTYIRFNVDRWCQLKCQAGVRTGVTGAE